MKLQLNPVARDAQFTGYGEGYVVVNGERHENHLLLASGSAARSWEVTGFDALTAADFQALGATAPEIIIFGSGSRLRFPHPRVTRVLAEARIGIEVMDTPAACRTYNILLAEGRKVLAAILID